MNIKSKFSAELSESSSNEVDHCSNSDVSNSSPAIQHIQTRKISRLRNSMRSNFQSSSCSLMDVGSGDISDTNSNIHHVINSKRLVLSKTTRLVKFKNSSL